MNNALLFPSPIAITNFLLQHCFHLQCQPYEHLLDQREHHVGVQRHVEVSRKLLAAGDLRSLDHVLLSRRPLHIPTYSPETILDVLHTADRERLVKIL